MLDYIRYCNKNKLSVDTSHKMYSMYQGEEVEVSTNGKLTMEDFMKAKKALEAANCPMNDFCVAMPTPFGFCAQANPAPFDMGCNKQEGKTPMNTERDYLNRRLREVNSEVSDGLRKQFNIDQDLGPKTYKELIAWVTGGQYTLDAKKTACIDETVATESWFIDPMMGITWTGRGVEDRPNYVLAQAARKKAYQAAQDIVNTGDAAAGLAALNEFAAFTYTVPVATPVAA